MRAVSPAEVAGLRERVRELMPAARTDLAALVSLPSVANPALGRPEAGLRAAAYLEETLAGLGFQVDSRSMRDGTRAVIAAAPGPPGSPTVLMYSHYDVQPAGDEAAWLSPPWELTERDGRWYGRGAADAKGNVVAHLAALRAVGDHRRCGVKVVIEGSEEWPSPGLERFVLEQPDVLRADAILLADGAGVAVGEPALTMSLRGSVFVVVTVKTLEVPVHSGSYGGAAPDALAALMRMLDGLRDERGATMFPGLPESRLKADGSIDERQFRRDAGVLDGVDLVGAGTIAERVWMQPSITVIGLDAPAVVGSIPAVPAEARARLLLRVPPGASAAASEQALVAQLRRAAPWGARVEIVTEIVTEPYAARPEGAAYRRFRAALGEAYGTEPALLGQGGSIPVCTAFAETYPEAEIFLFGVEEPLCAIHSPNESVDPGEIERVALAEALFLVR
jgi:cysteinylglycine-S-conjugate dipeptidase